MTPQSQMAADQVKVLVADASHRLRQRWCDVLTGEGRFAVSGVELLSDLPAACEQLSPDVLVLGLGDEGDGPFALAALGALRSATRRSPALMTIVLLADDSPGQLVAAMQAGARGIFLRDVDEGVLRNSTIAVSAGQAALDQRLIEALFDYIATSDARLGHVAPSMSLDPAVQRALSPREREVLGSLAQGNRNDEIAAQLGVSVGTVKTHLRHIYRKLDVDDRVSAVLAAHRLHLPQAA